MNYEGASRAALRWTARGFTLGHARRLRARHISRDDHRVLGNARILEQEAYDPARAADDSHADVVGRLARHRTTLTATQTTRPLPYTANSVGRPTAINSLRTIKPPSLARFVQP